MESPNSVTAICSANQPVFVFSFFIFVSILTALIGALSIYATELAASGSTVSTGAAVAAASFVSSVASTAVGFTVEIAGSAAYPTVVADRPTKSAATIRLLIE
ncbi:MAG: hypothetical protein Q620_VSAC01214G0002 [Veillonella sp. DORA_A_3_16_22]|nr:MAG: hypothetical protein Q620_VSAC01214G0002 [Veillonella sp. DORA_A_3_16_22]